MAELTCPNCKAEVPATGISSAQGIGDEAGNVSYQPHRQRATCASCGAKLVRNPEPDMGDLQQWRADDPAG